MRSHSFGDCYDSDGGLVLVKKLVRLDTPRSGYVICLFKYLMFIPKCSYAVLRT